ncbi:hypothetical protein ACFX2F_013404 [Malus domestica]
MPCDLGSELAGLGRSKCHALAYVKGRILGKLQGWKENLFAPVGKEVLIKAVAQAILTYPMNIFKVTVSICKDLNSMLTHFRWGQKNAELKISLGWVGKVGLSEE